MESHKICKVWALIKDLSLKKSNHWVKQVDISESTDINQSISMNQFYPIKAFIFIQKFFCFPIIHHNWIFSTHMRKVCYSNNEKPDICVVASRNVKGNLIT